MARCWGLLREGRVAADELLLGRVEEKG